MAFAEYTIIMIIANALCRSSEVWNHIHITLLVHTFREGLGGAALGLAWCRSAASLDSRLQLSLQSGAAVAGGGGNAEQVGSMWQHRGVSLSVCSTTMCFCLYWSGLYTLSGKRTLRCWARGVHETVAFREIRGSRNKLDGLAFSVILGL